MIEAGNERWQAPTTPADDPQIRWALARRHDWLVKRDFQHRQHRQRFTGRWRNPHDLGLGRTRLGPPDGPWVLKCQR